MRYISGADVVKGLDRETKEPVQFHGVARKQRTGNHGKGGEVHVVLGRKSNTSFWVWGVGESKEQAFSHAASRAGVM